MEPQQNRPPAHNAESDRHGKSEPHGPEGASLDAASRGDASTTRGDATAGEVTTGQVAADEVTTEEARIESVRSSESKSRNLKSVRPSRTQRDFARMSRRELLKVAPVIALGAFAIPGVQELLLKKGLGFSDWASARLFRRSHLAPTFADSELTAFEKFPINGYDVDDPGVIFENWTLTVSGAVQKPGDYTLAQIQALPRTRQNTRHVCVEGWDVIGRFGGARLSDFLNMIGADTSARFITVGCADDYYESLDMATALHPQTLLCYEMYDRPLTREHGAPLRLNIPIKVGYKQAKYLTDLKITNVLDGKVGYWEDQGYSEFYGL
jgi:DMSO/TMAO reductase YedYZ molybdopterin-dependent catalytic subunit